MGFGFPKLLNKVGVESRIHTSGESKALNSPFKPEKPEETLEQIPGAAPVVVTLLGLVIANSMLIGLAHSLTRFLAGGAE